MEKRTKRLMCGAAETLLASLRRPWCECKGIDAASAGVRAAAVTDNSVPRPVQLIGILKGGR